MTRSVNDTIIFAAGLLTGAGVTWLSIKKYYKTKKNDEVAAVREIYAKRYDDINKEALEKAAIAKNKPDISVYAQALQQARERETEETVAEEKDEHLVEEFDSNTGNLYEITPSEFASFSNDRTRVTITRFADDVFADEMYNTIDPREYLDGDLVLLDDSKQVSALDYIRRMPQDEICIRNFSLGIDIDVCTESRTYSDYMAT